MMLLPMLLLAAQVAAPAVATPAPDQEQAVRKALAARGMSSAGVETMIATQKKHVPAMRAIVLRGQTAESGIRQALAKRPVDVELFASSSTQRSEATAALSREAASIAIEQMRALSPKDRLVLATAAQQAPAKPPAR